LALPHVPTVRKLVVAVDGSPPSRAAGRYAVQLAKDMGARLHVIHVIDPSLFASPSGGGSAGWTAMLPSLQEAARTIVGETVQEAEAARVPFTVNVIEGSDVATGIVDEAEAAWADLIVVGSHGRRGIARVLVGSVAERVVRSAKCPVLVHRARVVHDDPEGPLTPAGPRGSDPARRGVPGAAGR
jgi:nucleotide-binding universal stress UspA family protein